MSALKQCATCVHWQRRGGLLTPVRFECVAFEDEKVSERAKTLLRVTAMRSASIEICPIVEPLPNYPDAYIAVDAQPPRFERPRTYLMGRLDRNGRPVETRRMTPAERAAAAPGWITLYEVEQEA